MHAYQSFGPDTGNKVFWVRDELNRETGFELQFTELS